MRRAHKTVLASGVVVVVLTTLVACVGGGGPLPNSDDQNPDVEKSGTSKSGTGSSTTVSTGGSTGGSTGTVGTTTPSTPPSTSSKTISVLEFSRSCSTDADCVLVFQGSVCSSCQCPGGAIAVSAKASYDAALADRSKDCPPSGADCGPCSTSFSAICSTSKQCTIGTKKADAG